MTSIRNEVVPKLRRAIGDEEEPVVYSDLALVQYVEDAINHIELRWQHGYTVNKSDHTVTPDIEVAHQMLFVLQAKLDMLNRSPDISFRSGSVSVTRKTETKKMLQKRIDKIINNLIVLGSVGNALTEFDSYENWLENYTDYVVDSRHTTDDYS